MTDETKTLEKYLNTQKELANDNLSKDTFFYSLGINHIRANRSEFGDALYRKSKSKIADILATPEGAEQRKNMSNDLSAKAREEYGYAEDIEVTDSQVAYGLYQTAMVGLEGAKLGDLEKLAKDKGAKMDFEVPEALKNYSLLEMQYLGVDPNTPVEEANKARNQLTDNQVASKTNVEKFYTLIKETMNACGASNLMKEIDFYAGINAAGKKLVEDYKKENSSE